MPPRIEILESLPDDAQVSVSETCLLLHRSRQSLYRDIAAGHIPKPRKFGRSTRFRLGDIRALCRGATA